MECRNCNRLSIPGLRGKNFLTVLTRSRDLFLVVLISLFMADKIRGNYRLANNLIKCRQEVYPAW